MLGLSAVGIHDNFFEIGGDSILSIQVIARAHAAGLDLTPREIFDNQTIATLASVARSAPAANCTQEPVIGPAVLTPIQRWFFEQELTAAHHWNQSVLLKLAEAPAMSALEEAFNALIRHHDALRSRFHRSAAGWSQEIAPPDQPVSLMAFDLRNETPMSALSAWSRSRRKRRRVWIWHRDRCFAPLCFSLEIRNGGC